MSFGSASAQDLHDVRTHGDYVLREPITKVPIEETVLQGKDGDVGSGRGPSGVGAFAKMTCKQLFYCKYPDGIWKTDDPIASMRGHCCMFSTITTIPIPHRDVYHSAWSQWCLRPITND